MLLRSCVSVSLNVFWDTLDLEKNPPKLQCGHYIRAGPQALNNIVNGERVCVCVSARLYWKGKKFALANNNKDRHTGSLDREGTRNLAKPVFCVSGTKFRHTHTRIHARMHTQTHIHIRPLLYHRAFLTGDKLFDKCVVLTVERSTKLMASGV